MMESINIPEGRGMEYQRRLCGSVALADFVGSIYAIPMLACLIVNLWIQIL